MWKDKAFFFFSYGGLRQITSAVFTGAYTPTAAERRPRNTRGVA